MNTSALWVLRLHIAAMMVTPIAMIGYHGLYQTILPALLDRQGVLMKTASMSDWISDNIVWLGASTVMLILVVWVIIETFRPTKVRRDHF